MEVPSEEQEPIENGEEHKKDVFKVNSERILVDSSIQAGKSAVRVVRFHNDVARLLKS